MSSRKQKIYSILYGLAYFSYIILGIFLINYFTKNNDPKLAFLTGLGAIVYSTEYIWYIYHNTNYAHHTFGILKKIFKVIYVLFFVGFIAFSACSEYYVTFWSIIFFLYDIFIFVCGALIYSWEVFDDMPIFRLLVVFLVPALSVFALLIIAAFVLLAKLFGGSGSSSTHTGTSSATIQTYLESYDYRVDGVETRKSVYSDRFPDYFYHCIITCHYRDSNGKTSSSSFATTVTGNQNGPDVTAIESAARSH